MNQQFKAVTAGLDLLYPKAESTWRQCLRCGPDSPLINEPCPIHYGPGTITDHPDQDEKPFDMDGDTRIR